ncbi:DUF92 domain-containing protein [Alkalihalobacillus sp. BA299]|uniref:DUF92 domain-containing protein n=1 Tax=Alkalihalobacillus sp. BA299 TaxID=2815938 RepID=UPI001FFE2766|nr:DUF92 domain-containing protein [Alkalihalobacillus sp. BA299]
MILSVIGVVLLAGIAYWFDKLSCSGMVAAIGIGSCIALGLEIGGLLVLASFFISSTFWSSYKKSAKRNEVVEKGERRDAMQVVANGGIAALISLLFFFTNDLVWIGAFIGALAAANSDTWSSEIGGLSKGLPYHILKQKRVTQGTSGAISTAGTLAGICGALLISSIGTCLLLYDHYANGILMVGLLMIAGIIGNFSDTFIGALFQVEYQCNICQITTEQLFHCQQKTKQIKGLRLINNDVVNFACTLVGSIFGALFIMLF